MCFFLLTVLHWLGEYTFWCCSFVTYFSWISNLKYTITESFFRHSHLITYWMHNLKLIALFKKKIMVTVKLFKVLSIKLATTQWKPNYKKLFEKKIDPFFWIFQLWRAIAHQGDIKSVQLNVSQKLWCKFQLFLWILINKNPPKKFPQNWRYLICFTLQVNFHPILVSYYENYSYI